jgi:hypothetical protein
LLSEEAASAGSDQRVAEEASFFATIVPSGTASSDIEHYDDLDVAVKTSSVVVVATVSDVFTTRHIGDEREGGIDYTGVVLRPSEVLRGSLPDEHAQKIVVEFIAVTPAEDLKARLPRGDSIWLLRRKGDSPATPQVEASSSEGQYYRVISSQGLFIQGNNHVINPISESPGPGIGESAQTSGRRKGQDKVSDRAEEFKTLSELADHVRTRRG